MDDAKPDTAIVEKADTLALLPCPFCGGEMKDRGYGVMYKVDTECPLSGYAFQSTDAWNRRALPAVRAEVSVAEAARVLLGDGDTIAACGQEGGGQVAPSAG